MAVFLTVLLSGLSMGLLAGRIYEILHLTDAATGFFYYKGIVFTPYMLGLFAVIVLCCGVLIFGDKNDGAPFFSHSSRIIAVASGAMLLVYSVMTYGDGINFWFTLAGGVALVLLGIFELHHKGGITDIIISVLLVVFLIGTSLDFIIFDVYTIYNVEFTQNALAFITSGMFFLAVFKNIFAPGAKSKMLLYTAGMLAAVMCGVMNIADIVCMAMTDSIVLPDLFRHAGYAFLGFFAFDNAISAIPSRKSKAKTDDAEPAEAHSTEEAEKDAKVYSITDLPIPAKKTAVDETEHKTETADTFKTDISVPESKEFDLSKNKEFTQFFARIEEKAELPEKSETKRTFKADKKNSGKVIYKKPK